MEAFVSTNFFCKQQKFEVKRIVITALEDGLFYPESYTEVPAEFFYLGDKSEL